MFDITSHYIEEYSLFKGISSKLRIVKSEKQDGNGILITVDKNTFDSILIRSNVEVFDNQVIGIF